MSSPTQDAVQSPGGAAHADERRMLRDVAAAFAKRDGNFNRVRGLRGKQPGFDREVWGKIAELGWLGIMIPQQYGGVGLGLAEMRVVVEELARSVMPEPVTACAVLACGALLHGDNEALKRELLPRIANGNLIAGLAWQEAGGSLDPASVETRVTRLASGRIVLEGTKRFVTPAAGADGFIVSARDQDNVYLYYLPATTQGIGVTLEPRADGTSAGVLGLSGVPVEPAHILAAGAVALSALARSIDEATVMASVELYGVMSRALETTIEYMKTRVQFGRKIGTFQALQHRAVDLYIQKALSMGAIDDAIRTLDGEVSPAIRSATASRVKSRCADAALAITRESIKLHGAIGLADECDIGLFLQRALVLSGWLGNGADHRRRYSKVSPFEVENIVASARQPQAQSAQPPSDTDLAAMSDEEFRHTVRSYFEGEYPEHLRYLQRRARWVEIKDWVMKLAHKGWIAPAWPKEYGGMGLSPAKQVILIEERERWGVARAPDQGTTHIGPVLIRFGTAEQKNKWLPKILSGEHVWCQGYSEPNAGSDLASLTTEAVPDGDDYVINGTKIWTTLAHDATHMFLLARTDKNAKRQEGISFFLLDLNTPGVTIRPIPNIEGREEFCQEFFDNVRLPKSNLIGEVNQGWTVAKTLLMFERLSSGSPRRPQYPLNKLPVVARARGIWEDAEFQSKFTRLRLDVADLAAVYKRYADTLAQGKSPDPGISMLKIWASETTQRLAELLVEIAGDAGYIPDDELVFGDDRIDVLGPFFIALHATISGGSNEIQRNILAKRLLGLPG